MVDNRVVPCKISIRDKDEFCLGYGYVKETTTHPERLPDCEEVWLKHSRFCYRIETFKTAYGASFRNAWAKGYAVADYILERKNG